VSDGSSLAVDAGTLSVDASSVPNQVAVVSLLHAVRLSPSSLRMDDAHAYQ
jgi:hypothetical protein